jgi:peroxiredoxin
MKRSLFSVLFAALVLAVPVLFAGAARVGETAPDFTANGSNGKTYKLSDFRGKFVVLEWHNRECPFTVKHYESGNMQHLQKEWTAKGVVWFTIISSSQGAQGFVTADQENEYLQSSHASPTAALLDPSGDLGHLYDAKTTPQMVIINPKGAIIYDGAIDDHATPSSSDIPSSKNYVEMALQEALAGKQVSVSSTRPYGCSVKYAGAAH